MFSFTLRGETREASSLAGISAAYCRLREASGEGYSTFPLADVIREGKPVAVISYNGRIWEHNGNPASLTSLNQKLIYCPNKEPHRFVEALEAIAARINGEFDHPALMAFGPLGNTFEDVARITAAALDHPAI